MNTNLQGEESSQNIFEKAIGSMMSGGTYNTGEQGEDIQIVTGQEYGHTPYSEMAEKAYASTYAKRATLDASEYYAVTQGYLREQVCMGQCNLFMQVLKNPMLRESMLVYRHDVCEPNVKEMKDILEAGGYALPAPYNAHTDARSIDSLGSVTTDVIDDRMILIGHIFAVEGFMNRWNQGAVLSHRSEVRDAFIRNYHRANRWHLAAIVMAGKMQFIEPQPEIQAQ
ncbi:hypothetical protein [Rufibacter quisquiliarum]|uniref:DUF3231 family protein n=1 Tax=Rufibacter quisquiliarum TaxID=1549639 RepID=A0A839GJP0_9BACT|nr:hypothetical protein [Rufibacter quisquiliarum]MBA9079082.1 hypothetical protein [Rufibacter quisquiliarum]